MIADTNTTFEKKYNNNEIYDSRLESCPLCKKNNIKNRYTINRFENPFSIDKCNDCNFMFMNPPFTDKVFHGLYNEDYYSGDSQYAYFDERDIEKYPPYVYEKRVSVIRRYALSGKFLDIGSSFGGLLNAAKKYYEPYGIEVSGYAGEYAKSVFGESIHIGTLHDHSFRKDFFSIITMIEVLEHITDPPFALHECYKLLKDEGVLVIQTANMDGQQAKSLKDRYNYFLPGHVSYFTKRNLEDALIKAGFKQVKHFHPVEFGLLPKLKKSRKSFTSLWDYRKWLRIAFYHYISKIHFKNFAVTSSLVTFAFK